MGRLAEGGCPHLLSSVWGYSAEKSPHSAPPHPFLLVDYISEEGQRARQLKSPLLMEHVTPDRGPFVWTVTANTECPENPVGHGNGQAWE